MTLKETNKAPQKNSLGGFHGGSVVKNSPTNTGDMGSISDLGISHIWQSN